MNGPIPERLYNLLPPIHRQRDLAQGEPLRALCAILEGELCTLEADVDALYENWFIETCEEWVVPYIGDLLGIRGLYDAQALAFSQRARVANTLRYRRRKGIAAVLAHAVQDATGWHSRVVEFFELVAATQHMQHVRQGRGGTVTVRDRETLTRLGSPFDSIAHRVDVRRIASQRGMHNVPNIGLFVWRLQSYPVTASATPAPHVTDGYTLHPLGYDTLLFNQPQPLTELTRTAETSNVPLVITRQTFDADLRAYARRYERTPPALHPPESTFYGPQRGLHIVKDGAAILPLEVLSADLSAWETWDAALLETARKTVAVDVRLGRLVFARGARPAHRVEVTYAYGFSADIGGGPYERFQSLALPAPETWQACVARDGTAALLPSAPGAEMFTALDAALEAWARHGQQGVIQIMDNGVYELQTIELPPQGALIIQAADGVRPVIRTPGKLTVQGPDTSASRTLMPALTLNGLLIAGCIAMSGHLQCVVTHCTIPDGLQSSGDTPALQVVVTQSIVGPLRLPASPTSLTLQDSIVGARAPASTADPGPSAALFPLRPPYAIAANDQGDPGPPTTLERTTVFGRVMLEELRLASDTLFTAPVTVTRQQTGAVRYSYVPVGSTTPQRYRCQPDLALASQEDGGVRARTQQRLIPSFTSTRYGDPGYAQLSPHSAEEIRRGAEDGSEMGVFHHLHQAQRDAALRVTVEEFLPAGLEAGVFYMT